MKRTLRIQCKIFITVITILIISLSSVASAMDEETAQEIVDRWKQEGNIDERGGVSIDTQFSIMYYDNILYALWDIYGYPDDVGGLFYDSDTGMMGFLLVDPTPERIAELRRLAIVDIVIYTSKYSWNELLRVQAEITALMVQDFNIGENIPDSGIYFTGTGWTSTDGVVHGFGENRREMRVTVGVAESMYDHFNALFTELYGDMVVVMVSGPIEPGFAGTDDLLIEEGADALVDDFLDTIITNDSGFYEYDILVYDNNTFLILFIIFGFGLLGTLAVFIWIKTRRINAIQTTKDSIVTESIAVSREQVITAVKESGHTPRDNLLETIIKEINK